MNKKVLIIGSPFSGKSYIASKLKEQGINAIDADNIYPLSRWIDTEGNFVEFPNNASTEWLSSHKFIWNKVDLKKFLEKSELPVYIFGITSNILEVIDLFDVLFYLDMTSELLKKRFENNERENPFGKTQTQEEWVLKLLNIYKTEALEKGFIPINADQSPDEIFAKIQKHLK